MKYFLFAGSVHVTYILFAGTVPLNNHFLKGTIVILILIFLISTFAQKKLVTFKVNSSMKFLYIVEDATNWKIEIIDN